MLAICKLVHSFPHHPMVESMQLSSTSEDTSAMSAPHYVMENSHRKTNYLPDEVDPSFASEQWRSTIRVHDGTGWKIHLRHLEVWVFSYLAKELKTGDICISKSDEYADYRG